jgi:hypothetical protein
LTRQPSPPAAAGPLPLPDPARACENAAAAGSSTA